jgi:fructosamine-3-kinase
VPVPGVLAVDAGRSRVPFAWQVLEHFPFPDLNHWYKLGRLDLQDIAFQIGAAVARWQSITPAGFGPFDLSHWRAAGELAGYHARYEDYFRLRLGWHLQFLVERRFLSSIQRNEIENAIEAHRSLLDIERGCLVHKDLALWNVLGSEREVAAFIDFDDAITGDAMDDLSLLACFHDGAFVARAVEGYAGVRSLPADHRPRFWLHLLRNMIVKAVIRVGAGYFDRTDTFFLIGAGRDGADLERLTRDRIALAIRGLQSHAGPEILNH